MLSQSLEVFKLSQDFFSEEKLHLSKKQLEEFTVCAQTSAQALQNTLVSKSAFLIKLVEFLKQTQVQVISQEWGEETFPNIFLFPVKPGLLVLPQATLLNLSPLGQSLCPLVNGVCTKFGIWRMVCMHPQAPALGLSLH